MTQRSRRSQRGTRYAGVLRNTPTTPSNETESRPEQVASRYKPIRWRFLSGAMAVVLVGLLLVFFLSDAFFVRSVSVGGLRYLTKEEVFAFTDVANMHIFWVSPSQVRENLLRSPSIADARVTLGWPPNMVNIVVEEREPALVWEQGGTAVWVDLQGRRMAQRETRDDLLRIVADVGGIALSDSQSRVPGEIVFGALQLQELLPDLTLLRYDAIRGLGYFDPNGWQVWFGTGTIMPEKVLIYQRIAEELQNQGVQPSEINVVNPDAPYYNILTNP